MAQRCLEFLRTTQLQLLLWRGVSFWRRRCASLLRSSATRELRRRLRAERAFPRFDPCLPRPAQEPPAGPGWIHEIKHDGFRIHGLLRAGKGILKVAKKSGVGTATVQRIARELAGANRPLSGEQG